MTTLSLTRVDRERIRKFHLEHSPVVRRVVEDTYAELTGCLKLSGLKAHNGDRAEAVCAAIHEYVLASNPELDRLTS